MADRLLFPKDVAAVLGCTVETARDLMRGMRCINTSRNPDGPRPRWAVTRTELERWQRTGTEVPASRIRKRQPAKDPTPAPQLPKGYDASLWEIDKNGNRRIAYRHSNRTA